MATGDEGDGGAARDRTASTLELLPGREKMTTTFDVKLRRRRGRLRRAARPRAVLVCGRWRGGSGELHTRRFAAKEIEGRVREMRVDTGKRMEGLSVKGSAHLVGNGTNTAAEMANSGELFRRPGGVI